MSSYPYALLELADERIEAALQALADIDFEKSYKNLVNSAAKPIQDTQSRCDSTPNRLVCCY